MDPLPVTPVAIVVGEGTRPRKVVRSRDRVGYLWLRTSSPQMQWLDDYGCAA